MTIQVGGRRRHTPMRRGLRTRLALAIWAGTLLLTVPLAYLRSRVAAAGHSPSAGGVDQLYFLVVLTVSSVGALLAARRPANPIGWLLLASGAIITVAGVAQFYVQDAQDRGAPLGTPTMVAARLVGAVAWLPALSLLLLFIPMLFPDGHLPGRRWRFLTWAGGAAVVAVDLASAVDPDTDPAGSPIRIAGLHLIAQAVSAAAGIVLAVAILGAIVSMIVRYRRSQQEQRHQLKWFTAAATLMVVSSALDLIVLGPYPIAGVVSVLAMASMPVSIAIAILKYRLYDIDRVISRSLLYGSLAGFITLVYVAIVVGIGTVVGSGGQPNLGLSILATAVVAVGFQPVRERLQRLANRLVYGRRASPYEVLSQFAHQVGGEYATEEVLPRIARTLVEGSGAARAEVYLRFGGELRVAASWPGNGEGGGRVVAVRDGELPGLPGADRAVAVRHQGELLGALAVSKPAGEPVTPVEEKLLTDLGSQAGLVLRNVRLTEELRRRLEEISEQAAELRRSRQRIVAAQDGERRRLERNIHDGAQQHLVALAVKLRLAGMLALRDPGRARAMLGELQRETANALTTLQELAGGIYPSQLRQQGLVAALRAQTETMTVAVEIRAGELERHPLELEAAVYFCCLEALQNIAKYAEAKAVEVRLTEADGELRFAVVDDGRGFDPGSTPRGSGMANMADRLEAFGGSLTVTSAPGQGTTVSGRLPIDTQQRPDPTSPVLQASTR